MAWKTTRTRDADTADMDDVFPPNDSARLTHESTVRRRPHSRFRRFAIACMSALLATVAMPAFALSACSTRAGSDSNNHKSQASCRLGRSGEVTLTEASNALRVTVRGMPIPDDQSWWASIVIWDEDFKHGAELAMRFRDGEQSGYTVSDLSKDSSGITDLDDALLVEGDSVTGTFPYSGGPLDRIDIAHWNASLSLDFKSSANCPLGKQFASFPLEDTQASSPSPSTRITRATASRSSSPELAATKRARGIRSRPEAARP